MNNEGVPGPLRSPLAVFVTPLAVAFLWACVYDSAVGQPVPATDSSGAEATVDESETGTVDTSGESSDPAEAPASGESSADIRAANGEVLRTGPRVRHPRPEDQPLGVDIAIEDRDGHSMDALHAALRRAERGEGQARLVFYGASHVASDLFTGVVRSRLQARFGDAGHGFVLPVAPWRSYRHQGVRIRGDAERWESTKVRGDTRDVESFGLHGVFVETSTRNAWAEASTTSRGELGRAASVFELFYYKQPRGGDLQVYLDGRPVERIRTRATETGAGYARYEVPDGPHSLRVRANGNGNVRLFGLAVERERPGVIVDTLGINGARARYHLMWEDQLYREHLRRRNPDLVVLAYGTNESGDDQPIAAYESQLREVVGRVRETVPNASCLLIGPSDRPTELEDGSYEDRPRTAQLIQAQHRVAVEMGCGFFDLVAFMGGPLSMVTWSAATPAYGAPDHVHFTRAGYERLGNVLHDAMMEGFER
ncbi:MAG: hypothetical protein H6726_26200 [Sandaracinaceae bacterium]|nr:SGNH/GDSL hydrolase family protein [Myxococcales bacterium]MCB9661168.1 hypothetical protein [Sandaracinaceae bacterium]